MHKAKRIRTKTLHTWDTVWKSDYFQYLQAITVWKKRLTRTLQINGTNKVQNCMRLSHVDKIIINLKEKCMRALQYQIIKCALVAQGFKELRDNLFLKNNNNKTR